MKPLIHFKTLITFIAGSVTGALLIAFIIAPAQDPTGTSADIYSAVNVKNAKIMVQKYLNDAKPSTEPFRSFTITRTQYEAMQQIAAANKDFKGFRIYAGKDNSGNPVGILMGLNAMEKEDTIHPMYSTLAGKSGPCPTYCDQENSVLLK